MKRLLNIFVFFIALIGFSACSNDVPDLSRAEEEATVQDLNFVSIDEALKQAETMFSHIGDKQTRGAKQVRKTEIFHPLTRTADNETMYGYYVVNYGEDEGFAMISADRRRPAI